MKINVEINGKKFIITSTSIAGKTYTFVQRGISDTFGRKIPYAFLKEIINNFEE